MTDSNATLLPCPFCGGEPEIGHYKTFDNDEWWIGCDCECGPCTKVSLTKEKAIEAWNMRHERTCHNTWDVELTGRLRFQCSECGAVSLEITPNYCPNCGAKVVKR